MSAMPAQRPSMLSSRLNALVMPTTQTSVSIMSSVSELTQFNRNCQARKTHAIATSITSFVDGRREMTSSVRPIAKINAAQTSGMASPSDNRKTRIPARTDRPIATPPKRATGRRCQRSSRGCATHPSDTAARLAAGTSTSDTNSPNRNGQAAALRARLNGSKDCYCNVLTGLGLRTGCHPRLFVDFRNQGARRVESGADDSHPLDAFSVEQHVGRNRSHVERLAYPSILVPILRPRHAVLAHEAPPRKHLVIAADAEDD